MQAYFYYQTLEAKKYATFAFPEDAGGPPPGPPPTGNLKPPMLAIFEILKYKKTSFCNNDKEKGMNLGCDKTSSWTF